MTSTHNARSIGTGPLFADLLASQRPRSAPRIDLRYWVLICLASIAGCNLGDFVSGYLHLGHVLGLMPLAVVFVLLRVGERRAGRPSEAWYWAVILTLRTAATNIADLLTHGFHMPYPWAIALLQVAQVLAVLPLPPRVVPSPGMPGVRPIANGWYWLAMLTAGTLGTVIGDCAAEYFHLGTGAGTLLLGMALIVILLVGARVRWATKAAYWFAIVAVRAAGTTAGDWLAFGGARLGLAGATAASCFVLFAVIVAWRPQEEHEVVVG
jgi:uncharacterized membrane-anchored protein